MPDPAIPRSARGRSRLGPALVLALFAIVVVATAWLCDDAFITFRTIDNFDQGYGLRWNVAERVQTYTHPLWLFVLGALHGATHEPAIATIILSILVSVAAVALVVFGIARTPATGIAAGAVLVFSRAFTDFSTSGLENPLTHLLAALFCFILFRPGDRRPSLLLLATIAALCGLNRIDALLGVLPALGVIWWRGPRWRGLGALALGFLPLVAWEGFSILYYGFPFPNTAYAKLQTGIARADLALQGLRYLAHAIRIDPVTPLSIVLAAAVALRARATVGSAVLAGMILHLAYVVSVGGDFMAGRFLTPAVLAAAVLVARVDPEAFGRRTLVAGVGTLVAIGLAAAGLRAFGGPSRAIVDEAGIADERRAYLADLGLWNLLGRSGTPRHPWAVKGTELRASGKPVLQIAGGVGLLGYYAGPDAHILDVHGLTDPFLARLPAEPGWRIGHFVREPRADYVESLRVGSNRIVDPDVARYVEALFRITRGDLFDPERLRTIVDFNLGRYDRFLEGYLRAKAARRGAASALPGSEVKESSGTRP